MSRFLLFDLGGVLADVDLQRAKRCWIERGFDATVFHDAFHASGAKPAGDIGALDIEGMRSRVESYIGQPFSKEDLEAVWGSVVSWRPYVSSLLSALTVPYGVLSTIDPVHAWALGPLPGAEPLVYSCEVGVTKPHPRIYEVAATRCPVPPADVRYIDDLPENVEGALLAGFDAHQVTNLIEIRAVIGDLLAD